MHASTTLASRYRRPALVVAIASTAFLFSGAHRAAGQNRSGSDIEEETRDRVLQDRLRQAEDLRTRQVVERFAVYVEEAAKLLTDLEGKGSSFQARFEGLMTNDEGKRLAQDPIAFMTYIRYKDDPIVPLGEIASRKKALDSLLGQLKTELKSQNVGFHPPESQKRDTDEQYFWVRERLARVGERNEWIDSALARAPKLADPKTAKPLEAVVRAYEIERQEFWDKARQKGEAAANEESESMVIDKARMAAMESRLKEAEVMISKMKAEREVEFKRITTDTQQKLAEAEIREKNLLAELDRAKKLAEATRRVEDAKAEAKSSRMGLEADKTLDKQRCEDPEVKRLLAPFLAHGKYQPGMNKEEMLTADSKAISLSRLRSYGAMEPTPTGIQKLLEVATSKPLQRPIDTMRVRWGHKPRLRDNSPESVDEMKKAQQLLIELGPTMVELGMLQP